MPAFDPVRDAVLNSPTTPMHIDLPSRPSTAPRPPSPSSATTSAADAALVAQSPATRRATDLSVLLNHDAAPPETPLFTPTTPRAPTGLSHLLNDDPPDQLSTQFAPLRRRSTADTPRTESREGSYFAWPRAAATHSPQHAPALALPAGAHSAPAAPQATAGPPAPRPLVRSPVLSASSRPSTAPSMSAPSIPLHLPPPPRRGSATASPGMPPPPLPVQPAKPPPSPTPSSGSSNPSPVVSARPLASPAPVHARPPPSPAPREDAQHADPAPRPGGPENPAAHPSLPPRPPSRTHPSAGPKPEPQTHAPPASRLPYAPRRRTPASSVLQPLSPAELARYKNYRGGVGTLILRKRKLEDEQEGAQRRPRDDAEDDADADADGERGGKRRKVGDVGLVVSHYNSRPDVGVTQRQDSPIIGLKNFNNWVKSVLITRFAHPAFAASPVAGRGPGRGRVLDLGCGKGGDLTKWAKARVREFVGIDIAAVSVEQAAGRHASLRPPRFAANFFPLDAYSVPLAHALPARALQPADVVSCQFAMHYAFDTEARARTMLANVAGALRPGGVFLGTVPNAAQLLARLDAGAREWGNDVYRVRFESGEGRGAARPLYGHRYWFFLRDAVDDVPEYVVQWEPFVRLAQEYGLQVVYKKEFHEVFEEHHEDREFGPLLERMHVVDKNGESQMDEDQWEAANIYIAFAFEKR